MRNDNPGAAVEPRWCIVCQSGVLDAQGNCSKCDPDDYRVAPPVAGPTCHICLKPATCFGTYEGMSAYSCDACCGHGGEDGRCKPADSTPTQPGVAGDGEGEADPLAHVRKRAPAEQASYFEHQWQAAESVNAALRRQLAETAAERDEERRAHSDIATVCFVAGVETTDGTSYAAVRELADALTDLRRQYETIGLIVDTALSPQAGITGSSGTTEARSYRDALKEIRAALHQGGTRDG